MFPEGVASEELKKTERDVKKEVGMYDWMLLQLWSLNADPSFPAFCRAIVIVILNNSYSSTVISNS